jgi:hypothetical protein
VRLADGLEVIELGAWRVDGSVKITSKLLRSHGIELREWNLDVMRVEANGSSVSLEEAMFDPLLITTGIQSVLDL